MKQTLYPKTRRVHPQKFQITEKLDGSNLGFFKYLDELYIAQRNNIYAYKDINNLSTDDLYGGLREWLNIHGDDLQEKLYEEACIFGEWISMGVLKYEFKNKFHIFAKANVKMLINSQYEMWNLYYDRSLLIYPFKEQIIPDYISLVPLVTEIDTVDIYSLNTIYTEYSEKVNRNVEGFVIIYNKQSIEKYVRMKDGSLKSHTWD